MVDPIVWRRTAARPRMRDQDVNHNTSLGVFVMSNTTSIIPPLMFFFVWLAAFGFMLHMA